jgi:hypothetical protein
MLMFLMKLYLSMIKHRLCEQIRLNIVEKKMLSEIGHDRYFEDTLKMHISEAVTNTETCREREI